MCSRGDVNHIVMWNLRQQLDEIDERCRDGANELHSLQVFQEAGRARVDGQETDTKRRLFAELFDELSSVNGLAAEYVMRRGDDKETQRCMCVRPRGRVPVNNFR